MLGPGGSLSHSLPTSPASLQGDWHMPKLSQHLAQQGINFTSGWGRVRLQAPRFSTPSLH